LKAYFNTRKQLTRDSYLFVNYGSEEPMVYNTVSSLFRKAVRALKEKHEMDYEQAKKDRPAEIRLYNLRKFFRKQANQAGFENTEYWMGHTVGVDANYRPKDPEYYRKIYAEKAAPFLRLETNTPTETEKQINELAGEVTKLREYVRIVSDENTLLRQKLEARAAIHSGEDVFEELKALRAEMDKIKEEYQKQGWASISAERLAEAIKKSRGKSGKP